MPTRSIDMSELPDYVEDASSPFNRMPELIAFAHGLITEDELSVLVLHNLLLIPYRPR